MAVIEVGLEYGGKQYRTLPAGTTSGTGVKPITLNQAGGYSDVLFLAFCKDLWFQVDVSGLPSGESFIISVQGSLDNSTFDDIGVEVNGSTVTSVTISADGTTLAYFRDAPPAYVRLYFNGTVATLAACTITVQAYAEKIS